MKNFKRRIHYGWIILFAGFLLSGTSIGVFTNCNTLFIQPVTQSLGFTRGEFSVVASVTSLLCAVMYPIFSIWIKRYPIRRITLISLLLCSLSAFGMAASTQLWQFYIWGGVFGMFVPGIQYVVINTLVNRWFDQKQGMALGIAACGAGVVGAVMIAAVGGIIREMGWQWGYRLQGIISLLLGGAALLLIREWPEELGLQPYGAQEGTAGDSDAAKTPAQGLTRSQAVKTPGFYLLIIAMFCVGMYATGIQPHIIPYLGDLGYPPEMASAVISLLLILMVATKPILGKVLDHAGPVGGALFTAAIQIGPLVALLLSRQFAFMPWVFAVTFSLGYATASICNPYFTLALFGRRSFTDIYALTSIAASLGGSIGSVVSGNIYDWTGGYGWAWVLYIVISAVTLLCCWAAAVLCNRKDVAVAEIGNNG